MSAVPRPLAVVTGASRGIGRAAAFALAERHCDVALLARDRDELMATASEVEGHGVRALAVMCDVAVAADVERAAEEVRRAWDGAPPRVVVNNAGIIRRGAVDELLEEDWDAVVDVNLKGTFLVTRAFLPAMKRSGVGRFVAIGSISSTLGTARAAAYCAAKWGVVGFTKSLAEELRGTGLQTLAVLPGSVDTDMLRGSGYEAQMRPEDVARVVTWAALDAPAAANGSAIEVYGP